MTKYEEYRKLDHDQAEDMLKVGFEVIPLNKVRENSFILVGSRYRILQAKATAYPMVSLGDERYFAVCSGGTPSSTNLKYWNGGINWITLVDLPADALVTDIENTERTISKDGLNNSNAKLLPVNTVVVSTRATIGRIGIARTELATNQGFKNIIIKDYSKVLPEYLAFVLTAKKDEMESLASGATFKEISKDNFCSIQIPLMPLDRQREFVNEIQSYRNIVFHAKTIINDYTPSFYSNNNWEYVQVRELFDAGTETVDPTQREGRVNFIGLENIESFTGKFIGSIECDFNEIKSTKRMFHKGDLLYGKLRPVLNKVAFASFDGICSTDIIVLMPHQDVLSEFYSIVLRDAEFNANVLNGVSGGQLPRIDVNYLFDLQIPKVPINEQRGIITKIREEQNLIKQSEDMVKIFTQRIQRRIEEEWSK